MMSFKRKQPFLAVILIAAMALARASAQPQCGTPTATLLVSGLQGALGSTVGPDGALYATEGATGSVLRVDPNTGETTVFASGLPKRVLVVGGATDVAFIGNTAYVLVTLVSPDVGGTGIDGIYRVDGAHSFTVVADIGAWSAAHPPNTNFDAPTGLQFAMQTYRGGFLVSDANHNRILLVSLNHSEDFYPGNTGNIKELIAFPNIVPTGLAVSGDRIYIAEAGPDPHLPKDGKVVVFDPNSGTTTEVATGTPFLLDVEFGRGRDLYALSQGLFVCCTPVDSALPNTGALVRVNDDGTFTVVIDHLDRPTSLELIGSTAFVVSLAGQIWRIDRVSCPPYGTLR
jgi:sugar lactone lactonase YvrE